MAIAASILDEGSEMSFIGRIVSWNDGRQSERKSRSSGDREEIIDVKVATLNIRNGRWVTWKLPCERYHKETLISPA
jgi:hypothetical protein